MSTLNMIFYAYRQTNTYLALISNLAKKVLLHIFFFLIKRYCRNIVKFDISHWKFSFLNFPFKRERMIKSRELYKKNKASQSMVGGKTIFLRVSGETWVT